MNTTAVDSRIATESSGPDLTVPDAEFMRQLAEVDPEEDPGDASDVLDRACVVIAKLMQEVIELHQDIRDARSALTASAEHVTKLEAILQEALPVGIEDHCDECGGNSARCLEVQPHCYIRAARNILPKEPPHDD